MVYEMANPSTASALFDGWEETLIWSCLQGVMGKIYVTDMQHPVSAMAVLGDFTFFAGDANVELAAYKPHMCTQDFMIMIPQNKEWEHTIMNYYGTKAHLVQRYAIKKEPHIFHPEKLSGIVASLPDGYQLCPIDEPLYRLCKAHPWSLDLVSQYKDYAQYSRLGLGIAVCRDGIPVSGASSYASYRGGIEIEIDTRKDYRRQGLASVCGAKLILECLKRNLYPSWDAQNRWSVALAEKLGYHYSHTYTAIEIIGY